MARVDAEVAAAAEGRAREVVVYADTTIDYGCRCPPFVLAPLWNSGRDDGYLMVRMSAGVADPLPDLSKVGLYRLRGRFSGERITGLAWLAERGQRKLEGMDEYAKKGPVFRVDAWCFEPKDEFPDEGAEEIYRAPIERMAAAGHLCDGAAVPRAASPPR